MKLDTASRRLSLNPRDPGFYQDPYPTYRRLQEEASTEPQRLDLTRTPNPHLSFGAGLHYCLGAPLARLELQTALPILWARLPRLELDEAPSFKNSYHFRSLESLRVRYRRMAPCRRVPSTCAQRGRSSRIQSEDR